MWGHNPPSWGTQYRGSDQSPVGRLSDIVPLSGASNPTRRFNSEVLPAPEQPMTAVTPRRIRSVTPSSRG